MNKLNLVVTGATKGIGRAIASHFFQNGFDVFVCARTQTALQDMAKQFDQLNTSSKLYTFVADVAETEQLIAFVQFIKQHTQTIDVLVNNAGQFVMGNLLEEEMDVLPKLLNVNVLSAYRLSKLLFPLFDLTKTTNHIFNISSIAGLDVYDQGSSYSISKFAMTGFSKALRHELKEKGVKVTTVYPGETWSSSWEGVEIPRERLMKSEDIATAIFNVMALSQQAVVEELVLRPTNGSL